jgi:zinc protease
VSLTGLCLTPAEFGSTHEVAGGANLRMGQPSWRRVSRRLATVVGIFASALLSGRAVRADGLALSAPSAATHFRLSNGLEVVLERVPDHPLVAVVLAYKAGWSYDPPGHAGLAHLVEHLTFRGSRHLPGQGIFERLEAVGCQRWNGSTSDDLATYYAVVPAEHFALPLWIESERMAFTLEMFSQESLALEQLRVKKELLQRGRVTQTFPLFLNHALYPERHPYHQSRDEIKDVLAAELSDAAWFFQRHYRPDNAYLLLVGGFPARAASEVRRYFGPIVNPPGPPPRIDARPRAFSGRETLVVKQPVYVDNLLVMVFPAPDLTSGEADAFELATDLLNGRGSWSLEQALVHDAPLAEWVEVEVDRARLGSLLRITAQVRHGVEIVRAERAIEDHLLKLARFDDARSLGEMRVARAVASVAHFADPLNSAFSHLQHLRLGGRPFDLPAELTRKRALSPRDVANVTRAFLDPRRRLAAQLVEGRSACRDGCVSHEITKP